MSQSPALEIRTSDMIRILEIDAALGIHRTELAFAESNSMARNAFAKAHKIRKQLGETLYSAFGKTHRYGTDPENDKGLQALIETKAPVITIVGKAGIHEANSIRHEPNQNIEAVGSTIAYIRRMLPDLEIVFDGEFFLNQWDSDRNEGDRMYALDVMTEAERQGANVVVGCDTKGAGFYDTISDATKRLRAKMKEHTIVGVHCHNDLGGMGVANSIAAADNGAEDIHLTHNGLAERTGMPGIAQFIAAAHMRGYKTITPDKFSDLTPASHQIAGLLDYDIPKETPVTGGHAHAHKAGMHTAAMKDYEAFEPTLFGNDRVVLISEQAGASTVREFFNNHSMLSREVKELLTAQNRPQELRDLIKRDAARGISYQRAPESFVLAALREYDSFVPHFSIEHTAWEYDSSIEDDDNTSASVTVHVNGKQPGEDVKEQAMGDGPVNAIHNALKMALSKQYPEVIDLVLEDYKVRKITAEGSASSVEVYTWFKDTDGAIFSTMGAGKNIVSASEDALADGIHFQLLRREMNGGKLINGNK